MDCIQEHYRVNLIQRAFLPLFYDREYLVCDAAYGAVGDVDTVKILHMALNVICSHPFCIHGDDFFLHVLSDR